MRTLLLLPVAWASIAWAIPVPPNEVTKVLARRQAGCPERRVAVSFCLAQDLLKWTSVDFGRCKDTYDAFRTCPGPKPPPSLTLTPGTVVTVSKAGDKTVMNAQGASSVSVVSTDQKGNSDLDKKKDDSSKDAKPSTVQVQTVENPKIGPPSSKDGKVPSVVVDTEPSPSSQKKDDSSRQQSSSNDPPSSILGSQSSYTDPTYSRDHYNDLGTAGIDPAVLEAYRQRFGSGYGTDYDLGDGEGGYGAANYGIDSSVTNPTVDNYWARAVAQTRSRRMDESRPKAPKQPAYVISGQAGGAVDTGKGWVISGQTPQ